MATDEHQQVGVRYVDPFHDPRALAPIGAEQRALLRMVNQKIAARPSLRAIVDYLFERTQSLIPCDRIGLAFVDDSAERVTSYYNRASYPVLFIDKDYSEALHGSSLEEILRTGQPRVIDDLEDYLENHPHSRSTQLLLREGGYTPASPAAQRRGPRAGLRLSQLAGAPHVSHASHRAADGDRGASQPGRGEGLAHRAT